MPEEASKAELPKLKIKPEVGRFIDVLQIAEKIAQVEQGTSISGLSQQAEEAGGDYSKLTGVIGKANEIVGPEAEYVTDYRQWQETKKAGSHTMSFHDWRKNKRDAYRRECERLEAELAKE